MTDSDAPRRPARDAVEALVVLDLQQDFLSPPEFDAHRDGLVAVVNDLARRAREDGALVVEVRTIHRQDGSTWTLSMQEDEMGVVLEGTVGAERLPELQLRPDEIVTKTRDSAFHGTRLAEVLDRAGVGTVAFVGVTTDLCVLMTAAEAFAHDLRVVLVEDGVAAADRRRHDDALRYLTESYRQEVVPAAEVAFTAPSGSTATSSARGASMSRHSTVDPC